MTQNPEELAQFTKDHLRDPKFQEVYADMGYLQSDLEDINLSAVAHDSKEFMKTLSDNDKEVYLKKKYEALVLRRFKIMKEVHDQFQRKNKQTELTNFSFHTSRSEKPYIKQQPALVVNELKGKQKSFFNQQNHFFDTVSRIRRRKLQVNQQIQKNQIEASQHYNLLNEKTQSLTHSSKSLKTSPSKSLSKSPVDKRREIVYKHFIELQEKEAMEKSCKLFDKLEKDKGKIQKVQENLKKLTLDRQRRESELLKTVRRNKQQVRRLISESISQKKMVTKQLIQHLSAHMQKFDQNRSVRIKQRDQKLQMQKSLFQRRQKQAQMYHSQVVEKQRQSIQEHLNKRQSKAAIRKIQEDEKRVKFYEYLSQINKKKEDKAHQQKHKLEKTKQLIVQKMYEHYNESLQQVVQKKDQNIKSVKTKLLEERIKEQIALMNMDIQNRQEAKRVEKIKEHIKEKRSTIDVIETAKDQLIKERRDFLGRTCRKLQKISKEEPITPKTQSDNPQEAAYCLRLSTARKMLRSRDLTTRAPATAQQPQLSGY